MESIPYTVVPQPTAYNIGVFLLNFNHRKDGLSLRDAFEQDFQEKLGYSIADDNVIREIMKRAEY